MYELSYSRTTHFWMISVTLNQFSLRLSTDEMESIYLMTYIVIKLSSQQGLLNLRINYTSA